MKKTFPTLTAVIFILLSFTQCKKDCMQSNRCNLNPDVGPCYAMITKYYYDQEDKTCKEFIWGGCEGLVPFDTMEACEKQCDCD